MKRQLERQRFFISAWYIGAGSLISVFTRKPNQPFSKLKSIYGNELAKHAERHAIIGSPEKVLTETDRLKIKQRIRQEMQRENLKIVISLLIAIIIVAVIVISLSRLIAKWISIERTSIENIY